jgi:hypothetical protein
VPERDLRAFSEPWSARAGSPRTCPGRTASHAADSRRQRKSTQSQVRRVVTAGIGCVELGTVTPQPVPGHNPGAAVLASNLACNRMHRRAIGVRPVIGVNLGLRPGSLLEHAWLDYVRGMQALWSSADYLVLNFTSRSAQELRPAGEVAGEVPARCANTVFLHRSSVGVATPSLAAAAFHGCPATRAA